jgi:hypothetical protein
MDELPGLVKARDEGLVGSRRAAGTETIEKGYGEGDSGGWTMGGGWLASRSRLKLTAVNSV